MSEIFASARIGHDHYRTEITIGTHNLVGDEPLSAKGKGEGPEPYEFLLASLGSCTAIQVRMYADYKQWEVDEIKTELTLVTKTENGIAHTYIQQRLTFTGNLSAEQIERLVKVADTCPVSKMLRGEIKIESALAV